jgi:hypothetical protein
VSRAETALAPRASSALGSAFDAVGVDPIDGRPIRGATIALGLGLLMLAAWPLLATVLALLPSRTRPSSGAYLLGTRHKSNLLR